MSKEIKEVKDTSVTFDQSIKKIMDTINTQSTNKKIKSLGVTIYKSGFTLTVDNQTCGRNLKTIQDFNNIINQL